MIDMRQYGFRQGFQNLSVKTILRLVRRTTSAMLTPDLRFKLIATTFLCQVVGAGPASAQVAYAVAGLAPQMRPEGAPAIIVFEKTADWHARALGGVSQPHPSGLNFLDSQGAWHTPFIHPGMTDPYDLRGWHARVKTDPTKREKSNK